MTQDQDTEGGPNATERDPAHLVVHVPQVPQKRPISPIPKPQPDGPDNQDGSTGDGSPAAQQYLSLANHLLLPHRVSRARNGAAGAAPARAPAPPTQAQARSVIGLRLPPERPRTSRHQAAPPAGGFWRCPVRTRTVPFKLSWKGKPRHWVGRRSPERRSAWFARRDQTRIQTPRRRRHGNAETPCPAAACRGAVRGEIAKAGVPYPADVDWPSPNSLPT